MDKNVTLQMEEMGIDRSIDALIKYLETLKANGVPGYAGVWLDGDTSLAAVTVRVQWYAHLADLRGKQG